MISILFFIFLTMFGIGVCITAYNFNKLANRMTSNVKNMDVSKTINDVSSGMTTQIIAGLIGAAGGLGSLVTGIIWIVMTFKP